ncbi:MAG: PQQ-binding-like beta-propeller repeat protein [Phycisphaerales bacterium]|nr:PQQ-binding-like beta-propeller repeat protein [Phycisphaerales bacterium]
MRKVQMASMLLAVGAISSIASAQIDPNAFWGAYRGNQLRTAFASVAAGPADNHAMTVTGQYPVSMGGFTVGANGDLYFKTHRNDANIDADGGPGCTVVRMDRATGAVLASVDLPGGSGNYSGLTHAVNGIWTVVHGHGATPTIYRLNATTLAVEQQITNGDFGGLRGAPLIGSVPNMNGHLNLYVHDRNNNKIHCVDSVTGELMWSYIPIGSPALFGKMGPSWTDGGKDVFAYFANTSVFPGVALKDNGDHTYTELWIGGPENFNWLGSGASATPGGTIYVNTFTDDGGAGPTPTLWAIDGGDGSVLWAVDGHRGEGADVELNFFSRPAVKGNRVYCCGGYGVVTCFVDNGGSYTQAWEYRDQIGEFTICTVVEAAGQTYVYAVRQGDPNADPFVPGELLVLRDDGGSFTQILKTDLNGTMLPTFYGANSATPDPDGNVWVSGGTFANPVFKTGQIYKFAPAGNSCFADFNDDGAVDTRDVIAFLNSWTAGNIAADCDDNGVVDTRDVICFLNLWTAGC